MFGGRGAIFEKLCGNVPVFDAIKFLLFKLSWLWCKLLWFLTRLFLTLGGKGGFVVGATGGDLGALMLWARLTPGLPFKVIFFGGGEGLLAWSFWLKFDRFWELPLFPPLKSFNVCELPLKLFDCEWRVLWFGDDGSLITGGFGATFGFP